METSLCVDRQESIWIYLFFSILLLSNELLQRKETQSNKSNTKRSQTTTIHFFTLLLTYDFLETIQIQTQEEKIA